MIPTYDSATRKQDSLSTSPKPKHHNEGRCKEGSECVGRSYHGQIIFASWVTNRIQELRGFEDASEDTSVVAIYCDMVQSDLAFQLNRSELLTEEHDRTSDIGPYAKGFTLQHAAQLEWRLGVKTAEFDL